MSEVNELYEGTFLLRFRPDEKGDPSVIVIWAPDKEGEPEVSTYSLVSEEQDGNCYTVCYKACRNAGGSRLGCFIQCMVQCGLVG